MSSPATKDEAIEALCFYRNVKINRVPLGGFIGKGWVVTNLRGYLEYSHAPFQPDKKKAQIYLDLFDAVVMAAARDGQVWAVDIASEQ